MGENRVWQTMKAGRAVLASMAIVFLAALVACTPGPSDPYYEDTRPRPRPSDLPPLSLPPISSPVSTPSPPEPPGFKPNLWVLAVAATKYRNAAYCLRYPALDAQRLSECLKRQEGRLFGRVSVKLLLDEHTTREEINDARETFLSHASVRDIVLIFLAGHGLEDSRGNFFFLTYDAEAERPYLRAYSWRDVQGQLLDGLPTQKVVLLVDTCYAGGVSGDGKATRAVGVGQMKDLDSLANRVRNATGCYIFMASTSKERAIEATAWGGGVFAAALIEALEGRAAKEGVVTILGLMDYVDRRVIDLTAGQQHPTWKTPSNAMNFPIAAVGK